MAVADGMGTYDPSEREPVFLFTDASYCPETRAAGWAACGINSRVQRVTSGCLARGVLSSGDAERLAFASGIAFIHRVGLLAPGQHLMVYSDHIGLMGFKDDVMRGGVRGTIARWISDFVQAHRIEISAHHVKAHIQKGQREIQHEINAIVDKLARERMREQRKQFMEADQSRMQKAQVALALEPQAV